MHTAAMINEISKKILNVIAGEHGFDLALGPGKHIGWRVPRWRNRDAIQRLVNGR